MMVDVLPYEHLKAHESDVNGCFVKQFRLIGVSRIEWFRTKYVSETQKAQQDEYQHDH